MVDKLPPPTGAFGEKHLQDFYSQYIKPGSFILSVVSQASVFKLVSALNPSKGTGPDLLPPRFLKDSAEVITPFITHIINLSITTGVVPTAFKKARVIPLFKKGSKLDPNNYRPVSILCTLSKVLERLVLSRLMILFQKTIFYLNFNLVLDVLIPLRPVWFT